MQTRRQLLGSVVLFAGAGCISVNREVASGGGGGASTPTEAGGEATTVPAGGGGGDPLDSAAVPIVANDLVATINNRRETKAGLPPLGNKGSLVAKLHEYAMAHSKVMQSTGTVAVDIEESELIEQLEEVNCSIPHGEMTYTYSGGDIALVGGVETRGQSPKRVAGTLVDAWLEQRYPGDLILSEAADKVAAGGAIRGVTFLATVIFC